MRTTITLPDGLLAQAKRRASQEGISLSDLVEAAVRDRVLRQRGRQAAAASVWLSSAKVGCDWGCHGGS